jgi:hypothetical protein
LIVALPHASWAVPINNADEGLPLYIIALERVRSGPIGRRMLRTILERFRFGQKALNKVAAVRLRCARSRVLREVHAAAAWLRDRESPRSTQAPHHCLINSSVVHAWYIKCGGHRRPA